MTGFPAVPPQVFRRNSVYDSFVTGALAPAFLTMD
jgi:hypothetical protein